MKNLSKYSSPTVAKRQLHKYYGSDVELYESSRPEKKYMINHQGRWVHFGQMGYEDYTKHKDATRRRQFRLRNYDWQFRPKWSPAHLSWFILW